MIKVTAIITTHNRLKLLKQAVESVLNQTYNNIELIVIDDHSSDGTVEWCLNNNITVFKNPSKGVNKARNFGIKQAHGDYVAFLDDDDWWYNTKIEKQVELAKLYSCGVIYCGIRKSIKTEDGWMYNDIYPLHINQGDVSRRILLEIFTVTSTLLINRKLLINVGLFDENINFWQEYELCIRLAQLTGFCAVNEILVNYLVDSADKSRLTNKYNKWRKSVKNIHNKHKNLYSKLTPIERIQAKRVEIWDGISRCENAGMNIQKQINIIQLKLSFIVEGIIRRFLK